MYFKFIIIFIIISNSSCISQDNKNMVEKDYFIHLYKTGQMLRYNVVDEKQIILNSIELESVKGYDFFYQDTLNRIYFKINDSFIRYYNIEDAMEVYQHFGKPFFSSNILFDLLDFKNGFLNDYDSIATDFMGNVQLSNDNLFKPLVDNLDLKISKKRDEYRNKKFTILISVVAKLVFDRNSPKNKKIILGETLSRDGITKVPVIISNGHEIPFFLYLYEYLYEHNSNHPIRDTYDTIMDIL